MQNRFFTLLNDVGFALTGIRTQTEGKTLSSEIKRRC